MDWRLLLDLGGPALAVIAGVVAWRYQTRAAGLEGSLKLMGAKVLDLEARHLADQVEHRDRIVRLATDAAIQRKTEVATLQDTLARREDEIGALRVEIAQLEADMQTCQDPGIVRARLHRLLQRGPS